MSRLLLLIPTTTYRTHDFMAAAAALEVEVVIASDRRQALADLTPGRTLALDFFNLEAAVEAVVEFAERYPIQTVVGVDDDTVLLAAMASEALGLSHNSVASVRASRYKHLMRQMLAKTSLPSPGFRLFSVLGDPEALAGEVAYPCVLKPVFLSASRGVIRADSEAEFVAAFQRIVDLVSGEAAKAGDEAGLILVEDYIPGIEVALEGLLENGKLLTLALFDKPDPLEGPFFAETLYVTPSRLSEEKQAEVREITAQAAKALGLRVGPVHAELRLNEDGVYVVEIAARSIGGLCSRVLKFGAGVALEELILRQALAGDLGELRREKVAAGVMMLPVPKKGVLRSVWGVEAAKKVQGIQDVVMTVLMDQPVEPLPEGDQYLGFIFAKTETPAGVEKALREAHRRLGVMIEG